MTYNRTITKAAEIISVALIGAGIAADGWTMQIISAAPVAADADRYTVAVYQPRHRIPSTVWALTIDTAHDGWTIAARTMECTYNRDTTGAEYAPRHALASAMTGRIRITAPDAYAMHLAELGLAETPDTAETEQDAETTPVAEPETETAETIETTETAQGAERDARILELMQKSVDCISPRSAWGRGVKLYACELLGSLAECVEWAHKNVEPSPLENRETVRTALLDGAEDWEQYSWGGYSLIYNGDIAERLCPPSELKRKRGGELPPNAAEDWLDVQARALRRAAQYVIGAYDLAANGQYLIREGARA